MKYFFALWDSQKVSCSLHKICDKNTKISSWSAYTVLWNKKVTLLNFIDFAQNSTFLDEWFYCQYLRMPSMPYCRYTTDCSLNMYI